MSLIDNLAERIRRDEPLPPLVGPALNAFSSLTRLGMRLRLAKPRTRVNARVISFGNITAGGTGKTPAVIERAQAEVAAGHKVAVLTRGYGGASSRGIWLVDSSQPIEGVAHALGDEPALILRSVPEVLLVKGKDRVWAAKVAVERHGCDTLILDDGFQYVMLERDENVVLIDATNPFGNERIVPRGILREPLTALTRATHLVLTRCDQAPNLEGLLKRLETLAPRLPVRLTRHAPSGFWRVSDGAPESLEFVRGKEVDAACAIGNPERFFQTLEELGATVVEKHAFRDHADFDASRLAGSRPLIVTEKDAVRLGSTQGQVYALAIHLQDWPST